MTLINSVVSPCRCLVQTTTSSLHLFVCCLFYQFYNSSRLLKHKRFVFIGVCVLFIVLLQNGINTLVTVLPFSHYHCLPVANYFFKPVLHIIQHIAGPCNVTNDINVNDFRELLISGDSGSHAILNVICGIGFLRVNKLQRHKTKLCAQGFYNTL